MSKVDIADKNYEMITDGVIPWYNFKGRIGCWFEPMDGPEEIKAIMEFYVEIEDYEKAQILKEKYEELKEYMIKEEIWKT